MLNFTGVMNNVTTILGLIQRLEPAVLAIPEVQGLVEAAISAFSNEDKAVIEAEYVQRMGKTDADHEETQQELQQAAAATVPGSGEVDASPKGGGLAEEGGEGQPVS